ncbi:hypothetical protein CK203_055120 [Vitis vinifera]|uniref:Uncharacterized protein n=1 Tax=Vitis vinifera TaxID=29760 RepID=A0A438GUG1_VITVI|nr:hypothetical protein CK203_055120 [Vitis vinifera]
MARGHPFEEATHTESVKHRLEPLTPFLTWRKLEEAIRDTKTTDYTPGVTSSCPESSLRRTPTKRARTSGPRELSRHSQSDPRSPVDSQRHSGMSPEAIIKRPMVTAPPIEGNSYCRTRPFHSELYFDLESMTTHGVRSPTVIHFSIDGRQGILEARHVAEALHIP